MEKQKEIQTEVWVFQAPDGDTEVCNRNHVRGTPER